MTEFGGRIGDTIVESEPWWPEGATPGPGAPNVVVIVLDDLGFAHLNCFGSDLHTPNFGRLADRGLRYTNFHATPLCSPSRAALLTGRNHHEVGMRAIANFNTGFPHMTGRISPHAATMAELLRDAGYATYAVGKWHLCPMDEASAAGPFQSWPLQRGFDRFYGFLDGETDQFFPELVCDNHPIRPPRTPQEGYHLTEDLVDQALGMIRDNVSLRPDRPFFTYLALGAMHAPHQAPRSYLDKYRGAFDEGWDITRHRWFERQKAMGIVPSDTELAPRNPGVEPWKNLSENQRLLGARLQEAFAAFLDHTDAQIGRLLDELERIQVLDDTLIVVVSDNGASQEGGPDGVMHEMKYFNFIAEDPDEAVNSLDRIGGPDSHTNYPWGWAQAGNTPFKWYKQNTHEGGVHVPLILSWPNGISDAGSLRHQFHHINDLAPTIYELLGISAPQTYRGEDQIPVSGTSMAYSFAEPEATGRKRVQYFEMMGHRGIYAEGWKAVTRHLPGTAFDDDHWELYNLVEDRSECRDLAATEPDKLESMIELWWTEAKTHGVLPLDDRTIELFGARFGEHSIHRPERRYRILPPVSSSPTGSSPVIGGRSWALRAVIDRPAHAQGVLFAYGTATSGLTLFIANDHLVFDYNAFGDHSTVESEVPVPEGRTEVGLILCRDSHGRSGSVALSVEGNECGSADIPLIMSIISSIGASYGEDAGSPVSNLYEGAFAFTGEIEVIEIELLNSESARSRLAEARAGAARQ